MSKNEVVEKKEKTFDVVLSEKLDASANALPREFNKTRFVTNAMALLSEHPELKNYGSSQVMNGLLRGAYLGLDFINSDAYLVPFGDKLSYMTSYKGMKKLARKYAVRPVHDIYAMLIKAGDTFTEKVANGIPTFDFEHKQENDDNAIIGAFACVVYKDGGVMFEKMTIAEIEKVRNVSKAKNAMAWKDFYGEQAKKTVLRRLCKNIDIDFESVEMKKAWEEDTDIDFEQTEIESVPDPTIDDDSVIDAEVVENGEEE